jgi:hypothetical protein
MRHNNFRPPHCPLYAGNSRFWSDWCFVVTVGPALLQERMKWERYAKLLVCKFIFFLEGIDLPLNEYFSTAWTIYTVKILFWTFRTLTCMTE